jgi:hypothetical protein
MAGFQESQGSGSMQGSGSGMIDRNAPGLTPGMPKESNLIDVTNDIERRLKILEDRYTTIRKKTQTTDENLLGIEKRFTREIKAASSDLLEIKRGIALLQEKLGQFESELAMTARHADFRALEAYVAFIEPMQFVTRSDLKLVIRDLRDSLFVPDQKQSPQQ